MAKLVLYIRVSTQEQGRSKNGLEAQEAAVRRYAELNGHEIVSVGSEVASGKLPVNDRPVLKACLEKARQIGGMLIVNKVDRLARTASIVLGLMDSKVKFIISELGETMDSFMVQIYAVFAEKERQMIADRTKAGLASVKARGVKLGNPTNLDEAQAKGRATQVGKANEFASSIRPTIERMRRDGMKLSEIADELNTNGTKTARGGMWSVTSLSRIIARWN